MLTRFGFACLALFAAPAGAVTIDGHIDPVEWRGAQHITDFRQTQPLTGKPATYPVEAWVLATPKGLAVAVRVSQPPSVSRSRQHVQRDFQDQVDRVNVMVDFNGDGRTGYDFAIASTGAIDDEVITNESNFNRDWDGIWQHAVTQDAQGWSVEVLIPWYTAPMHAANDGTRTLGIYIDRVIAATGERAAWPVAAYTKPRFLSEFKRIEVPAYSQSLLAVTPYVSALYDNVRKQSSFGKGADVFWKPNGQFQLTATINPDFGQVESDDLVVNFGATETFFSDKRPFFTESQGIFDFSLLDDNSQLVYTRRVGGPADDGNGAGDIDAAVKFNGSIGTTNYGVLAADERGDAGRTFGALRVVHDFGDQSLGMMLTRVDHPFLDRTATVLGVDHHWHPSDRLTIGTNLVGSDIDQSGQRVQGTGATFLADYEMDDGWRQQWLAMHFDDKLQVNDFGFLERNNFDYLHYELRKRITDLPADSRYADHDWHFRFDALDNDDRHLTLRRELRINRNSDLRDGSNEFAQINIDSAGYDDLLTRGHNALHLPPAINTHWERTSPRHGSWAYKTQVEFYTGGLSGNHEVGWDAKFIPTYYVSDNFSLYAGPYYEHTPDWLIWQHDNLIGRFNQHTLELDSGFDWYIGGRSELRLKLQAIGLDARIRGGYEVAANGEAIPSSEAVNDFRLRQLGVQVRYRYELAPLSYLYVVYGRGGFALDDVPGVVSGAPSQLGGAFSLRDDEQILVKLDYRFEL
ncbi:MAG TPA: DUF5916 domain-containing protein [Rhodanobacteraceae bacterium]|nr:DUF5916 domain-containing protein [Rhodanobacteraceae bacterium]